MKSLGSFAHELTMTGGRGLMLAILCVALPASAQVACPPGYGYSYGYGCVPVAPAYAAVYGPQVVGPPPVYDTFGIAFGFRGGHDHGGYDHGGHGHDDHDRGDGHHH